MERRLIEQSRAFDLEALAAVYDQYSPGIYRYAMRLLGDTVLAEECVGETFSRFLAALKNGGGPEDHLQAYLYRIAHNWVTDHYRRSRPFAVDLNDDLPSETGNPAQSAAESMESAEVRAALRSLTPDQRQVVVLKYLEGWDNEKIAGAVQKPVTAVKALQHRALCALRRLLIGQEEGV